MYEKFVKEKFVKEKFGGHDRRMFDKLEESLLLYKETHPQSKIKYQMVDGDHKPLIVAIVTPLMLRVHQKIKTKFRTCVCRLYLQL